MIPSEISLQGCLRSEDGDLTLSVVFGPSCIPFWTAIAALAGVGQVAILIVTARFVWRYLDETQKMRVAAHYSFEYRLVFKEERMASYTISARPLEFEETGNLSFLLTADSKIYQTREDRDALLTDGEH